MIKILEKFVSSIKNKPIVIFPIPTYHYYFDGAKPTYKNLFKQLIAQKRFMF